MKLFDLHPKAATAASKKTVIGGIWTTATIIIAFILIILQARVDLGERAEDVRINTIAHDETTRVEFDVSFLGLMTCNHQFEVEVLDALGRKVEDPAASVQASYSIWSTSCRVHGTFHVPSGKGTFRIYPALMSLENLKPNHRIDRLFFGERVLSGVPAEARVLTTLDAISDRAGAWSYYLSLVPTTSNGVNGFQIAATRTFIELSGQMGARGSLFFYYEASPIRMHLDSSLSAFKVFHFLARCLGIISGLFAFVGAIREVAFTAQSRIKPKKKSSLVM